MSHKILITDYAFPNRYSTWRNTEILSFIEEYNTDVLVYKTDAYGYTQFKWDFKHKVYGGALDEYQLFSLGAGRYLVSKNKPTDFRLEDYDAVHHIFFESVYRF